MAGQNKMEEIFEQTLLYDFYGELLTEHQKSIYEDVVLNDMSLTEVAENYAISRQAVSDLMKRIHKLLKGYEAKLHLVEKFTCAKGKLKEIQSETNALSKDYKSLKGQDSIHIDKRLKKIQALADAVLEDF